jgi:hypothetical protein
MMKRYLVLLIIIIVSSCGANDKKPAHHKNRVIFFGPSTAELESSSDDGMAEAIDDFTFYIYQTDSILKKMKIETSFDTSGTIMVKYGGNKCLTVDRNKSCFGYIYTDGIKAPLVVDHVMVGEEIIQAAKDYFKND